MASTPGRWPRSRTAAVLAAVACAAGASALPSTALAHDQNFSCYHGHIPSGGFGPPAEHAHYQYHFDSGAYHYNYYYHYWWNGSVHAYFTHDFLINCGPA